MTSESDAKRIEDAEQQVFDEQQSNARATSDTGPRDDDQADELADEASDLEDEVTGDDPAS